MVRDFDEAPPGLIHALALDGAGQGAAANWGQVQEWSPQRGCLWLHFRLDDPEARTWIANSSGLSEVASSALLSDETRPRALHRGSRLLLALRGVNPSITQDRDDMISLRIWTDGKRVISTRFRGLQSTDAVVDALRGGHGPRDVQGLLVALVDGLVARLKETVDDLEDQAMALDERVLRGEIEGVRSALSEVRKQVVSIRRYLAPQREAMNRLVSANLPWLDEDHRILLRETTDRLLRHIEGIDEIRDRAVLSQEELLTQVSEAMNKRAYVFTVVATIFLPLGFLTGLMGINVGGMPGVDSDLGFWVVVGLCGLLIAVLALVFRFNRWL